MTPATSAPVPLHIRAQTLEGLGWTAREADWLTTVCFHSGVFTRTQYAARYGLSTSAASRFALALRNSGTARETPLPDRRSPEQICHVHSRVLYRTLGIENNRHRRRASPDLLMRRLLSLDYILEHPDLPWLPTEPDKRAYFNSLGLSDGILPQRLYTGAVRLKTTRRFFALKLPIAAGDETRFVFVDPGARSHQPAILKWAETHASLWAALHDADKRVHVVAVTRTATAATLNEVELEKWRGKPAPSASDSHLSPEELALITAVERAQETGDYSPLHVWGGPLTAGAHYNRLKPQQTPTYIDAYSLYVAHRLAPDALAL